MEGRIQRNSSIDLLRIMATIGVILIHVSTAPVGTTSIFLSGEIRKNLELIHILVQCSVPVFFMITGFCMMQKENCSYSYCFSKVVKYIITLFTVGLFYALLEGVYNESIFDFRVVVNAVKNVIAGYTWDHMWFIYSIIGVYLVIPVIHSFMKQSILNCIILTAILFVFSILFPWISKDIAIGFELPFDGYLVYVCFGALVAKCSIDKKWIYISIIVILVSCIYLYRNVWKQLFGFNHLIVCLMAMAIFILVSQMKVNHSAFWRTIAKCSWGIYLIHPFYMNLALKWFKINLFSNSIYINLLLFAVFLFASSLVTTYILRKVPVVRRIF